jgi:uncharacterized protein (DUF305 family)
MTPHRGTTSALNWRAAALLGLVSSTFSTLVSQLSAARLGRDAAVDWMVVASIPLRDGILASEPTVRAVVGGILFHQWADFSWAMVFFGLFGRWTASLGPRTILLLAMPWAVLTSALEWVFLVPLIPFSQPIFTLVQVYWIGLLVHVASAAMYPLFPTIREWLSDEGEAVHRRFARKWVMAATGALLLLAILAGLGRLGYEVAHIGRSEAFDQTYMRRMAAHHEQGVELASIAAERATNEELKALARLMAASQAGEISIFRQWWRSWFDGELPPATAVDHSAMKGMLPPEQVEELRTADASAFDRLFVERMSTHHRGAISMAESAIRHASDPRLRIMAIGIRHEQRGEIDLMNGARGVPAVRAALATLVSRSGSGDYGSGSAPPP